MRFPTVFSLLLLLVNLAQASSVPQSDTYHYRLDLREVENDQLTVELIAPVIREKTIRFYLPKIIPGTYTNSPVFKANISRTCGKCHVKTEETYNRSLPEAAQRDLTDLAIAAETGGQVILTVGDVRAPMHGILTALHVREGQEVRPGDRLAVLEAMKMQHEIVAEIAGRVGAIPGRVGAQIAAGDPIMAIEAEEDS